jgi:NADPH:quinone reductase-like Zn-dependent oxidoreductase
LKAWTLNDFGIDNLVRSDVPTPSLARGSCSSGGRVIATSSSDDKLARATALGAAETINYGTTPAWDEAARRLTGGRGVDHVLDVVGADNLNRSVAATRVGGRVTVAGFIDGQSSNVELMPLIFGRTRVRGIAVGHLRAFERLIAFLDGHQIEPVVDAVYGFDDVKQAYAHLDRGPLGKIVVRCDSDRLGRHGVRAAV